MKIAILAVTGALLAWEVSLLLASSFTSLQAQGSNQIWMALRIILSVSSLALYSLLFAMRQTKWSKAVYAWYVITWCTLGFKLLWSPPDTDAVVDKDSALAYRYYTVFFTIVTIIFVGLISMNVSSWVDTVASASSGKLMLAMGILMVILLCQIISSMVLQRQNLAMLMKQVGVVRPGISIGPAVYRSDQTTQAHSIASGTTLILPDHFDCRQKWPHAVSGIRDQHTCGSCVIQAATSMLADRAAIAHNWSHAPALSVQYVLDCLQADNLNICSTGSQHVFILAYLTSKTADEDALFQQQVLPLIDSGNVGETFIGLTSVEEVRERFRLKGGTCSEVCYPYASGGGLVFQRASTINGWITFVLFWITVAALIVVIITKSMAYNQTWPILLVLSSSLLLCGFTALAMTLKVYIYLIWSKHLNKRLPCETHCRDGSLPDLVSFDSFRRITGKNGFWEDQIDVIKMEILTNGPVVTGLKIAHDFPTGRTYGVYETGFCYPIGAHAVCLIGWGLDYWIVRNSWGKDAGLWYDKGYFHIKFGTCGIEDDVWAGHISPKP